MEKKELTIKQRKRKYKIAQKSLQVSEYVSAFLPFCVMAIVNRDEWFVYNPESWKIGLGGTLGLCVMGLAMFLITKKKDGNEKLTNGMIALVIGWYVVAFIFFLLAQINMEIYKIMFYGGLGLLGALGLEIGSKKFEKKYNELDKAMELANTNLNVEQATKEIVQEKNKKKKVEID